jgi:hypothetical protein
MGDIMKFYRIQENDSPMSIAYQYTGDGNNYWQLLEANPRIPRVSINFGIYSVLTFDPNYFIIDKILVLPDNWFGPQQQEYNNKTQTSTQLGTSGVNESGTLGNPLDVGSASWEAADIIITGATLVGDVAGGVYMYHAKGGFWWTLLGIIIGGIAGNLTGRLVTLPLRK